MRRRRVAVAEKTFPRGTVVASARNRRGDVRDVKHDVV
jgi:hypothetical protein